MPYCKSQNMLWIHIPKTGGTSVFMFFLQKYSRSKVTLFTGRRNSVIDDPDLKKISLQHQTYQTLVKYSDVLKIDFCDDLKIFTIVRNPYHRIVSDLFGFEFIHEGSTQEQVFDAIRNKYLYDDNLDNHNIPQFKFICDENENIIPTITILKTETLKRDMNRFGFDDFNIQYGSTASKGISVQTNEYINYLNSDSISIINEYYSKDFELFGYEKIIN